MLPSPWHSPALSLLLLCAGAPHHTLAALADEPLSHSSSHAEDVELVTILTAFSSFCADHCESVLASRASLLARNLTSSTIDDERSTRAHEVR